MDKESAESKRERWLGRAAVLAAVATLVTSAVEAQSTTCTRRTGVRHVDWSGDVFTQHWVCGNRANAPIYAAPHHDSGRSSTMRSTNSWFVCWVDGQEHRGGNNIWYYTQGDTTEEASLRGWGYMPAYSLYEDDDPWPGMPRCPWW